ncbi:MAG: hypothetical protein RLZZ15_631 [Verrucomicrobiota bacterium]|jgi:hypothetical protein
MRLRPWANLDRRLTAAHALGEPPPLVRVAARPGRPRGGDQNL